METFTAIPGGNRIIKRWYYVDIKKAIDPLIDREETIISVPEDRVVRSNFGRDVKLDLSSKDHEYEHHMIPTEDVIDGMGWGFNYAQYWIKRGGHPDNNPFNFFERFTKYVLDNFSEYKLPVINLTRETPKEAVCNRFREGQYRRRNLERIRAGDRLLRCRRFLVARRLGNTQKAPALRVWCVAGSSERSVPAGGDIAGNAGAAPGSRCRGQAAKSDPRHRLQESRHPQPETR